LILDAAERFRRLAPQEQEEVIAIQTPPMPEPRLGILPADSARVQ
jgi:hypothetical protein